MNVTVMPKLYRVSRTDSGYRLIRAGFSGPPGASAGLDALTPVPPTWANRILFVNSGGQLTSLSIAELKQLLEQV